MLWLEVVWSPEVFLLARLTSAPASLGVLRRGRVGAPGAGWSCLVIVPTRLLLLLLVVDSRITLGLLVTIAATGRLGKPLGTSELLLLQ